MAMTTHSHSTFFPGLRFCFALGMNVYILPAGTAPANTNAPADADGKAAEEAFITNQESLRSYLQIQEQLHNLQAANDKIRLEAETAAARNAELLPVLRLDGLQEISRHPAPR